MRLATLLLALIGSGLWAGETLTFAVRRAVADTTEREELAAVELDRDVYGATRDGFPDLRLQDAAGLAVPFIIQRHTRTSSVWSEHAEPARRVDGLVPDAEGNRLEVIVEPPRTDPPRTDPPASPIICEDGTRNIHQRSEYGRCQSYCCNLAHLQSQP